MTRVKIPNKEGDLVKEGPDIEVRGLIKDKNELIRSGIMSPFVKMSGQFLILPKGVKIVNSLYKLLEDYIAKPLGFEDVILPKIIPIDTIRKADMINKWNGYLMVVRPFSETKGVKEDYFMDPLQCTGLYQFFENKVIDVANGPVKWYDRSGPTYRNEGLDKIEPSVKQREFHRCEFMYIGTKEQVIEIREKCLAQLEKLCNDLGLRYRIVVGSDCYQLKEGEIKDPETHKEIAIKDLEVYIPHQNRWLEIAGCSALAETMTKRFCIKGKDKEPLWSGCTGVGLNRLLFTLVSYHGTELMGLPNKIKERLNER